MCCIIINDDKLHNRQSFYTDLATRDTAAIVTANNPEASFVYVLWICEYVNEYVSFSCFIKFIYLFIDKLTQFKLSTITTDALLGQNPIYIFIYTKCKSSIVYNKRGVHYFVLHNFHLYLTYDNVFSVHKHLTLNSNTQRHWLIYFPFKIL